MPEMWLSYGQTDVVLDIRAENLAGAVEPRGKALGADELAGRIAGAVTDKPAELVALHVTPAVLSAISAMHAECESRSKPFPRVLTDPGLVSEARAGLPEGASVSEFGGADGLADDLVFVAEAELSGLFGFETVATRLLRRFGGDEMRGAYLRRASDLPSPGQDVAPAESAREFASRFDVRAIELVPGGGGIADIAVGHPSETMAAARALGASVTDAMGARHKSAIISTGRGASGATLSRALNSLWSCAPAVADGGLAVLLAECAGGLGSPALEQFVMGELTVERTRRPPKYVGGMEDVLFLSETKKRIRTALVSALPLHYTRRLGIESLDSGRLALERILREAPRQKVAVISDGAHTVLR